MVGRLGAIVSELLAYWRSPAAPRQEEAYPRLRAMVGDVLDEGRRKHLIHLVMQVDVTGAARPADASLTAWVAKAFADAVDADRRLQGYRRGSRLVVFDDVDVCCMVEQEVEGATMPLRHIVRAANRKDAAAIHAELQRAKAGGCRLSPLERSFFDLPRPVRRLLWGIVRRDPALVKELMGTVGLTSMGMFGTGAAVVLPIAPMTLSLSIGTLESRDSRSLLHLNLTADHEVVDGAPLMRFAERLRQRISHQ